MDLDQYLEKMNTTTSLIWIPSEKITQKINH